MRLGCPGCLTLLVLVAALVGGVWVAVRTLQEPPLAIPEASARRIFTVADRLLRSGYESAAVAKAA